MENSKNKILLTNTLSQKKETFCSFEKNKITIYHCGPTVYWNQHIGNLRAFVLADLIIRTFMANGYDIHLIRNYTDVGHLTGDNLGDADSGEDRIEKAAKKESSTPFEIAQKYIDAFEQDLKVLNILTKEQKDFKTNFTYSKPRATNHIQDMIEMVEVLLKKDFAYSTPLAIYFDTSKKHDYTKLSRQKIDFQKINEGHGEIEDSENKKNPSDFALWFFKAGIHKNALQTWPSPFSSPLVSNGTGFPGWHIECSAMCLSLSGKKTIDIHMGGVEHIPIHHTNEIAQSESANNAPLANYWLHNEHLMYDNGKMSKSNGTSLTIDDLASKLDLQDESLNEPKKLEIKRKEVGKILRFFFLQSNYRSKQNFTEESFRSAKESMNSLINKIEEIKNTNDSNKDLLVTQKSNKEIVDLVDSFYQAINNDFNFPEALAVIFKIAGSLYSPKIKLEKLEELLPILGLDFINEYGSISPEDLNEQLADLFYKRQVARQENNWEESDRIRTEFEKQGYEIRDKKNGKVLVYLKT